MLQRTRNLLLIAAVVVALFMPAIALAQDDPGGGGLAINPILATAIPLVVMVLRNVSKTIADNGTISIIVAVVLAALVALAEQLGIPIPGGAGLGTSLLSAGLGIGGLEVAKNAPGVGSAVRKVNKSKT